MNSDLVRRVRTMSASHADMSVRPPPSYRGDSGHRGHRGHRIGPSRSPCLLCQQPAAVVVAQATRPPYVVCRDCLVAHAHPLHDPDLTARRRTDTQEALRG